MDELDDVQEMLEAFNDPIQLSNEKTLNTIIDSEWLDRATSIIKVGQLKPSLMIIEFIGRIPYSAAVFKSILYSLGPIVFEKGTDTREPVRQAALDCICAWYSSLSHHAKTNSFVAMKKEMEDELLKFLTGKNPRGKEFALSLLSKFLIDRLGDIWSDIIPVLVGLLNDSVETVRKMAKDLLVELSHDGDRGYLANIQKEISDQNIRSKIAECFIVQKVVSSPKVTIRNLEKDIQQMIELFKGKETEQNWQKREASLKWFKEIFVENHSFDYEEVVECHGKHFVDAMLQCTQSLRTSVSLLGLNIMRCFLVAYSPRVIDSVAEQMFNGLVKASTQTKKIVSVEISSVFQQLFEKTTHGTRLISQIYALIDDKNVQLRDISIQILTIILQKTKKEHIEKSGNFSLIEKCLEKGLADAQPHIREKHRDLFLIYQTYWPNKSKRFLDSLDQSVVKAILRHNPKNSQSIKCSSTSHKFDFSNLESGTPHNWVVGIENIMTFSSLDENSQNPFSLNESLKISSIITNYLESENLVILQAIADSNVIPFLLSKDVLHLHDFFGPLLDLQSKDISHEGKESITEFINAVQEKHVGIEMVELIFSSIKSTNIPNVKKNRGKKIQWLLKVNERVLTWFVDNISILDVDQFFAQYANVQFCLSKLIPLLQLKICLELRELILQVILIIYRANNLCVLRSLETFDVEVSKLVRERIHGNNQIVGIQDETFVLEDEKSNVFDETLPSDFADNTFQLVNNRGESPVTDLHDLSQLSFKEDGTIFNGVSHTEDADIEDHHEEFSTSNTNMNEATPCRPSGLLGVNQKDGNVPMPDKKYYNLLKLFRDETPKAVRSGPGGMPALLDSLSSDNYADASLVRQLFRISREYQSNSHPKFWEEWFLKLLELVVGIIENCMDLETKENFIFLLKELILHQTPEFNGHEYKILKLLLECRSHESNMISATANDALNTAIELFDADNVISTLCNLCAQWSEEDSSKICRERESKYRPLPLTSGLYYLGKVLGSVSNANFSPTLIIDLSIKCLNASQPEIRKAAVDSLVGLYKSMGDDVWNLLEDKLSEMQRKLVLIYIEREMK